MRASVDENCTGCGVCVDVCPEVFELSDDEVAKVIVSQVPEAAEDTCREAAEGCPTEAIHLEE